MTLPASGQISMSQVSVELGRASTATTSLGETAVRTLAGVPSGAISMSNLWGKANAANFFSTSTSGGYARGESVAIDPSGNIIIGGNDWVPSTSDSDAVIAKYTPAGSLSWYVLYGNSTNSNESCRSVDTDSSGNVYAALDLYSSPFGFIIKLNSSGALQWSRAIYMQGAVSTFYGINPVLCSDSSGNVYCAARIEGGSDSSVGLGVLVVKFDSSGTVLWNRYLRRNENIPYGISVNGTYVAVTSASNTSFARIFVLNQSTGALVNNRSLSTAVGSPVFIYSVEMDSSNIYATVRTGSTSYSAIASLSITSVSTINWQTAISTTSLAGKSAEILSPYFYWLATPNTSSRTSAYVMRGNLSDGSINWARTISTDTERLGWLAVNNDAYVFIGSESSAGSKILTARLPLDGSKTGTYSVGGASVVYGTPSISTTGVGITTGDGGSFTNNTNGLATATTPTQQSRTFTASTTTI